MKFVRKEYIVTTVFDKDVKDKEVIKTIFTNLKAENVRFSIVIRKNSFNLSFESSIVSEVHDSSVDLISFKKNIKTAINNVLYDDIISVDAKTLKNSILDSYEDVDRWDILDL